jgi:outer membrane protein OmpA-like peptidoglycan-associated protein
MKPIHPYPITVLFILFLFPFLTHAQKPKEDSIKIKIVNLGKMVNTPFLEAAPVISADGLMMLFTSHRPVTEKEIAKKRASMDNVYVTNYDIKKKVWTAAERLSETINSPGRNNSAIGLSNDGQRMLLYRDIEKGNGDIYESVLVGKEWGEPQKLPAPINTKDMETSASISPDGKTIYFVSNRKGGIGGRDIWYCTQQDDGTWGEAKNIGPVINTKEDEEGVYIHPDGKTLYFSSKGHNTLGGYDIFYSDFKNGEWSTPVNLGPKVNTPEDDVYFVLTADGKKGYYASDRPGGQGDKDIYEINFSPNIRLKKDKGPKVTLLKGIVIDADSLFPVGAKIEITDNEKNKVISTLNSNSSSGKFLISLPSGKNYGIAVKSEGYLFYSDNLTIPDSAAFREIIKTVPLKKFRVGNKIVLNNVFYDFDKASLRSESISELERLVSLLNENPTMKIELGSHTDGKGADDYNQKLSQARAQSVVDFLSGKGINKDRLVAKGYGKSMPIATNDTEEGRQMNRRTEFKILSK